VIEQRPNEAYLAYLARCAEAGEFHPPTEPPRVREVYIGPRFAAVWLPRGLGCFRAYKGSGWRFLQLWRVRFAVRWGYE
jgi:hypothetical protein